MHHNRTARRPGHLPPEANRALFLKAVSARKRKRRRAKPRELHAADAHPDHYRMWDLVGRV